MAKNKNQHFVPKCYLKPFTQINNGKFISLYNINKYKLIEKASIKNQCSRNYFYGEDLSLEGILSLVEGEYAKILARLQANSSLQENDLFTLKRFALLQHMRTEHSIKRAQIQTEQLNSAVSNKKYITGTPQLDTSHRETMLSTMMLYSEVQGSIDDLKVCICLNTSKDNFVTSDDPSVFTNRFYLQKKKIKSFGLGSAGTCFFLPLTPRYLMICYDGGVYTIPNKKSAFIEVNKKDVEALNELQFLKSSNNIYFSDWSNRHDVTIQFKKSEQKRPTSWCETQIFIKDKSYTNGERFIKSTEKEAQESINSLIYQSLYHPIPTIWFSKLKYRHKPQFYFNGSASGYVRKSFLAWKEENKFNL